MGLELGGGWEVVWWMGLEGEAFIWESLEVDWKWTKRLGLELGSLWQICECWGSLGVVVKDHGEGGICCEKLGSSTTKEFFSHGGSFQILAFSSDFKAFKIREIAFDLEWGNWPRMRELISNKGIDLLFLFRVLSHISQFTSSIGYALENRFPRPQLRSWFHNRPEVKLYKQLLFEYILKQNGTC